MSWICFPRTAQGCWGRGRDTPVRRVGSCEDLIGPQRVWRQERVSRLREQGKYSSEEANFRGTWSRPGTAGWGRSVLGLEAGEAQSLPGWGVCSLFVSVGAVESGFQLRSSIRTDFHGYHFEAGLNIDRRGELRQEDRLGGCGGKI